jgi:cardiolipin synthase
VNLPNLITLARLISVPAIVWLILDDRMLAAFLLFVAAGISDALDGFIAKHFNRQSVLGSYLDPLADKALLVSVYVGLGYQGHLPSWLVILVVFRDVLIIGGALLIHTLTQSLRMEPLAISKINTGFQIALAALVLAKLGLGIGFWGVTALLVYVVAVTTVLSGAAYLVRWSRRASSVES